MRLFLFIFFTLIANFSFSQTKKQAREFSTCRQSWQYFNLQDSITGKILFHKKAGVECGIFASASVSLIKTTKGDTIRVLELCNTKKDFVIGSFVTIIPEKKPDFGVEFIPVDAQSCSIKQTCFGSITKKK